MFFMRILITYINSNVIIGKVNFLKSFYISYDKMELILYM